MKIRPGTVYRNLFYALGGFLVFYTAYQVFSYSDSSHVDVHRRQKHLYLTVSKDRIEHRFGKLAPKRILLWTTIFGKKRPVDFSDCKGFSDRCIVTSNKSLITAADAVVFHAADIPTSPLPEAHLRRPQQRYVFLSMETPGNSGRHAVPLNFFNWTATHLFSSDVIFKYGVFYLSAKEAELKGFKFVDYHIDESKLFKKRKSGIFGLISNCQTASKRELAIKELSKYINITIGGKCALDPKDMNLCLPSERCVELFEQYPFYFAIENSVCKDYVTEKYWDRTMIPSIPIVLKRKIYDSSNMPPHSFVAMDDYDSPQKMAAHLKQLESDKKAYAEYFAWRKGMWTAAPWNAPGYRNGFCRLCERLWEEDPQEKVIEDVWAWFDKESQCERDEFVQSWIK